MAAAPLSAQLFSQQGFLEWRGFSYPRDAPGDSGAWVSDLRLRWDSFGKLSDGWAWNLGLEGYFDSHRQDRRDAGFFWFDNSLRRPIYPVRHASLRYLRGGWRLEAGKQHIRWGQAEFYSPTDRFAPRDFVEPLESETMAVTGFRAVYSRGDSSVDAAFVPRLSPSRLPVPSLRWLPVPSNLRRHKFTDVGTEYPGGTQYGVRFHRASHRIEWSASWFDGYLHTPNVSLLINPFLPSAKLLRRHPRTRMVGADIAVPLGAWTLRGESAGFWSPNPLADDYVQYVGEAEWSSPKWRFLAGYTGEKILAERVFRRLSPDRVFARVATVRLSYNPSLQSRWMLEGLAKDDAGGWGIRASYSRGFGNHWRLTAMGTYLDGDPATIIGGYYTNSGFSLRLRYSF